MRAEVVAVSRDGTHRFRKVPCAAITLITGIGVSGDAHAGTLVQHRSRVGRAPNQPNLRQVHLLPSEFLQEWHAAGHALEPGDFGENILTAGLDLHALPTGTHLRIGDAALRVTGLRNPCRQIDDFSPGLLRLAVARADGAAWTSAVPLGPTGGATATAAVAIVRRAGIMAVVERGGDVRPGMPIDVALPAAPHAVLRPV